MIRFLLSGWLYEEEVIVRRQPHAAFSDVSVSEMAGRVPGSLLAELARILLEIFQTA